MTVQEVYGWPRGEGKFSTFLRNNGLSLVAIALFVLTIAGQALCGHDVAIQEAREHDQAPPSFSVYLASGDFVEAVFENWESEFLQMGLFVLLTKYLRQKGSSESKSIDRTEEVDRDPREQQNQSNAPWPVRKGGILLMLYQRSLSLCFMALFALSFVLHAYGGVDKYNAAVLRRGGQPISMSAYFGTDEFWYESFQNWQSEFLSVACLVLASIVLRERGSPQSKPVAAPHSQTGGG